MYIAELCGLRAVSNEMKMEMKMFVCMFGAVPQVSGRTGCEEPPRRQGLGSHFAPKWAISDYVPVQGIGNPRVGRGWVATVPTCAPFLILFPCGALGTPGTAGVR